MKVLRVEIRDESVPPPRVLNAITTVPGCFLLEIGALHGRSPIPASAGEGGTRAIILCKDGFSASHVKVKLSVELGGTRDLFIAQYDLPGTKDMPSPIFVLGSPFAGVQKLSGALLRAANLWTPGRGLPVVMESVCGVRPGVSEESDYLDSRDVSAEQHYLLRAAFLGGARNRSGELFVESALSGESVRLVGASARNCFRVALLNATFPECRFVLVYRDPVDNIASIIDGWRSKSIQPRHVKGRQWLFVLPPEWLRVLDKPIAEVATFQWAACMNWALDGLGSIPKNRWCVVRYEQLMTDPTAEIDRVSSLLGLTCDMSIQLRPDRQSLHPRELSALAIQPPADIVRRLLDLDDG
jgi:hypothetical protein